MIIENGYTGLVKRENIESIISTVIIGITTRRITYLNQFLEGLNTLSISDYLWSNRDLLEPLFTLEEGNNSVDSNYVFSILKPQFSSEACSKRVVEEHVFDNFQDFLNMLEDEQNTGPSEQMTYDSDDTDGEKKELFADLSPAGILKWMTGQSHKPLGG